MSGSERIRSERQRQLEKHSVTSDRAHNSDGELWKAARCYFNLGEAQVRRIKSGLPDIDPSYLRPEKWPWDFEWWHPEEDPIRNFEKAGALCLAEADRRQSEPDPDSIIPKVNDSALRCAEAIDALLAIR